MFTKAERKSSTGKYLPRWFYQGTNIARWFLECKDSERVEMEGLNYTIVHQTRSTIQKDALE